jgi:hypothetical protein
MDTWSAGRLFLPQVPQPRDVLHVPKAIADRPKKR